MTPPLAGRVPRVPRPGLRVALLVVLALGSALLLRPEGPAALIRSIPVGRSPSALAIDARTARVFVANGDDASVSMLDARSGALLRTIAVGYDPDAVAVDARTQHAFVVNAPYPPKPGQEGTVSLLDTRTGALLVLSQRALFD